MSGHTPGPWESYVASWKGEDVVAVAPEQEPRGQNARMVCIVTDIKSLNDSDVANARLIAAVPDYDNMAHHLVRWWRLPNAERTIAAIEPVIREALDAIAKAEARA
jgi:hypothetical protein